MGLGKIRKYSERHRFAGDNRAHRHGWAGWQPPRHKLEGRRKPKADSDNWEDLMRGVLTTDEEGPVRVIDLTAQPPEGQ